MALRCEYRNGTIAPRVAGAGLESDRLAHAFDLRRLRPRHRTAKLGEELGMGLCALRLVGSADRGNRALRIGRRPRHYRSCEHKGTSPASKQDSAKRTIGHDPSPVPAARGA